MSENVMPAVKDTPDFLEQGVHLFKIVGVKSTEKKDKDGNPQIEVLLDCNGIKTSEKFYYPADASSVCKSEFVLKKFKKAFGMAPDKVYSLEQMKLMKAWGAVAKCYRYSDKELTEPVTNDKDEHMTINQTTGDYYHYNDGQKPILEDGALEIKIFFPAKEKQADDGIGKNIPSQTSDDPLGAKTHGSEDSQKVADF